MIAAGIEVRSWEDEFSGPDELRAFEDFGEIERSLACFTYLRGSQIVAMMNHVTKRGWSALEFLDQLLATRITSAYLNERQIDDFLAQVRDLIDRTTHSTDLSSDIKDLILDRLLDVEAALLRSSIAGANAVELSVDGLMGVLMRLYLRGVEVSTHPVTRGALALIGALAVVLGMGADYSELASSPLGRMLELPE